MVWLPCPLHVAQILYFNSNLLVMFCVLLLPSLSVFLTWEIVDSTQDQYKCHELDVRMYRDAFVESTYVVNYPFGCNSMSADRFLASTGVGSLIRACGWCMYWLVE